MLNVENVFNILECSIYKIYIYENIYLAVRAYVHQRNEWALDFIAQLFVYNGCMDLFGAGLRLNYTEKCLM